MNNISDIVRSLAHAIEGGCNLPRETSYQYAWWILTTLTGKDRIHLLISSISAEQYNQAQQWVHRLIDEKIPLAYLIGSVQFCSAEIHVKPPILIPRPETEEWCAALIQSLEPVKNHPLRILDLCTGSGCIAIALALALPSSSIYATDISPDAVALAQENITSNECTNIVLLQSDLFNALTDLTFDLIVSNPPYIAHSEWEKLDPSVRDWEDQHALIAPQNGLAILETIVTHAPQFLHTNETLAQHGIPNLVLEIGHEQGNEVTTLMKRSHFSHVKVCQDMAGKDRVVQGRVEHVATATPGEHIYKRAL